MFSFQFTINQARVYKSSFLFLKLGINMTDLHIEIDFRSFHQDLVFRTKCLQLFKISAFNCMKCMDKVLFIKQVTNNKQNSQVVIK